jgi:hypothetical protein
VIRVPPRKKGFSCSQKLPDLESRLTFQEKGVLAQEAEEQLRSEYAGYLRSAAGKLLESRPAHEKAAIEDLARAKARPPVGGTGFLSNTLFELERTRLTIDRYPGKVLSFDQWRAAASPAHEPALLRPTVHQLGSASGKVLAEGFHRARETSVPCAKSDQLEHANETPVSF